MSINQVILLGFLGSNPTSLKSTKAGAFVRLSLATSQNYLNDKGEWVKKTEWHTIYVSNKLGEFTLSHFKKGDKVFVKGRLQTRMWQDKNEVKHFSTAVYADELHGFVPSDVSNPDNVKQDFSQEEIDQFIAELDGETKSVNQSA